LLTPANDGSPCDDGNSCSGDGVCAAGTCLGGSVHVETVACDTCGDGIDNDVDTRIDSEDLNCSTLADASRFAVVARNTSTRNAVRLGRNFFAGGSAGSDASLPYPLGPSLAGVCGGGMSIGSGVEVGLLATLGGVRFAADSGRDPITDMGLEVASNGGRLAFRGQGPYVGPLVCSDDRTTPCTTSADCAAGSCTVRVRMSETPNPFVISDGSSENHGRCGDTLASLAVISQGIAAYTPSVAERVSLANACPFCRDQEMRLGAGGTGQVTVGGGLQVIDVEQVHLAGGARLQLAGQDDTVLVIRVRGHLRLGARARVVLISNGAGLGTLTADRVLWHVESPRGRASLGAFSEFAGTLLSAGKPSIRLGIGARVDGAVLGQRVRLGNSSTVNHIPFMALLP
jgi:hypothetical protein